VATLFTVSVLCLAFFIYDHWSHGNDTDIEALVGMIVVAIIPVLNIGMVIYIRLTNSYGKVILKGRGK
jgi:hypothetical protein